YMQVLQTPHSF
nr:immunoglobulin light chain junction region [Macaca mulatta]MPN87172.1 immunoglobulin light chain junction region [Macaca mulatta]